MNSLMLVAIPVLSLSATMSQAEPKSMPNPDGEIRVTILFDNFWTDDRLNIGWGFAALVETPQATVLFDTGADGDALLENMRLMGKDPRTIDAIVISHAHGDHTGGLAALFGLGVRPPVYLLGAFPTDLRDEVASSASVIESAAGQEIFPSIRTTGQVGSEIPEQALILDTAKGIVVITGCAHPGIVHMVERAQGLSSKPLHLVMGGFHLMQAPGAEIERVLTEFQRLGVERAGPTHCSGLIAMTAFQNTYGENFQRLGVGRVLTFPLAS